MFHSGTALEQPFDIATLLDHGLSEKPDDLALVSALTRWTWRQLDDAVTCLAGNLLMLGLKPGDRVASLMPNRAALVIHYLACFRTGLVMTPLNYRYTAPEIDHALDVSGASILLSHGERADDLAASQAVQRLPLGLIEFDELGDERHAPLAGPRFSDLISSPARDTPASASLDPSSPAAVFFTSGSTGKPKGVTHGRAGLGWMFASTAGAFEFQAEDRLLPGSSMSHMGGFAFSLAALAVGARVVIARHFDAEEILPLMRDQKPTVLCMIPTALMHLIRDSHAKKEDFASLRLCRSGSDKVPAELEKEFVSLTGFPIDEGYGMTEVGLTALNPPSGRIKIGSIGTPNPGCCFCVRDDNGREVSANQEGRLWMKTPAMMTGYWNNPTATAEVLQEDWLDSGDLMYADEDGYFWFKGRKKQIIVHDGSNICPQEVEESLMEHPAVDNAGAVGVHDLVHGENVRAYVALKSGVKPIDAQTLISFSKARIGYKAPEEIYFLDSIPLNPTGKVDRVTLKRWAAADHAHALEP